MSQATILVVDDDPAIVNLAKTSLEEAGYAVLTAFDGANALQLAINSKVDLMVLDVNMPMTHGLRALQFLRSNNATKNIPVILLTGANSEAIAAVVRTNSQVVYLKKPVDLESLHEMVRRMLPRQSENEV